MYNSMFFFLLLLLLPSTSTHRRVGSRRSNITLVHFSQSTLATSTAAPCLTTAFRVDMTAQPTDTSIRAH